MSISFENPAILISSLPSTTLATVSQSAERRTAEREKSGTSLAELSFSSSELLNSYLAGKSLAAIASETGIQPGVIRRSILKLWYQKLSNQVEHFNKPLAKVSKAEQRLFHSKFAEKLILQAPYPESKRARRIKAPAGCEFAYLYDTPLLTSEQEFYLFRQFNFLRFRAAQQLRCMSYGRETLTGLKELQETMNKCIAVHNRIQVANLRLLVNFARKRPIPAWTTLPEIVAEIDVSLSRAIRGFDHTRGYKLSTYATHTLISFIRRGMKNLGGDPRTINGCENEVLDSRTRDSHVNDMIQAEKLKCISDFLTTGFKQLDMREHLVLRLRFGLDGQKKIATLKEVAAILGVTKERVRQLETRALNKLQEAAAMRKQNFESF